MALHPSAQAFLQYVQEQYAFPIPVAGPNLEFQKHFHTVASSMGIGEAAHQLSTPSSPFANHHYIVSELWKDLVSATPAVIASTLKDRIAVGCLEHMHVNAACVRSDDARWIAVVINNGLLTLINKVSKLYSATLHPEAVLYCNRGEPKKFGSADYRAWIDEVTLHYRDTGIPLGPQIVLDPKVRSAVVQHGLFLRVAEMFVLAHEIGHILNGHLDEEGAVLSNKTFRMLPVLVENSNWERESQADITGFSLARRELISSVHLDDRALLFQLVKVFDLLAQIGSQESATHPHPIQRLLVIVDVIYGPEAGAALHRSYEDYSALGRLASMPLVAVTDDVVMFPPNTSNI